MNKSELIEAITDRVGGDKKNVTQAVDAFLDTITRTVAKGERVVLTGFGSFEKKDRPARTGRNPATGASVKLKKTSVPKFKPGSSFKDVVSGVKKLPRLSQAAAKPATDSVAAATGRTRGTVTKSADPAAKSPTAKSAGTKATAAKSTATKGTTTRKAATTAKSTTGKTTEPKAAAKKSPAASTTKKAAAKATGTAKKAASKVTDTAKKAAGTAKRAAKKSS